MFLVKHMKILYSMITNVERKVFPAMKRIAIDFGNT